MKPYASAPQLLFEDRHLILLNKPPGWLAQIDQNSHLPSAEAWALEHWRASHPGKQGWVRAVHRLDTRATGILCLSCSHKGYLRLQKQLQTSSWEKVYLAQVEGHPPEKSGELHHIMRHGAHRAELCSKTAPGAKEGSLHYEVIQQTNAQSTLRVQLHTGRYHQIRLQCAAMGCPILGDFKYGARQPWPQGAIALHHTSLSLQHPVTGERLHWSVPAPWENRP